MNLHEWPVEDFDIIDRYTRAQAIEDGVLVDLCQDETASLVYEAGFRLPLAMTVTAFSKTVAPRRRRTAAGTGREGASVGCPEPVALRHPAEPRHRPRPLHRGRVER